MGYEQALKKIKKAAERKAKRQAKALELGHKKRVKKVPKAKLRKRLVKTLDKEFSLSVRAMWPVCFFPGCGKPTQHCFHIFTRAKRSIRWDYRNSVGSCAGCNMRYEQDQAFIDDVRLWFVERFGQDEWDRLKADGNKIANHSNDDLQFILDKIRGVEADRKESGFWGVGKIDAEPLPPKNFSPAAADALIEPPATD